MKVTLEGESKEIAALVVALQERQAMIQTKKSMQITNKDLLGGGGD